MTETYYIGAYWGARKESAEECARRLQGLLERLAQVDPLLTRWFKRAKNLKEALKRPVEPDLADLQTYVQRGILRSAGGMPLEGAGFNVWLWNGETGGGHAWLKTYCGDASPSLPNSCLLEVPPAGPGGERALSTAFQTEVLRCMAEAWEPDWGVAMSQAHRELIEKQCPDALVGWVTYLSRHRGRVPPLPAPIRIEPVRDQGALVILTPERFTASNPEHVALAERARELLARAGVLDAPRS